MPRTRPSLPTKSLQNNMVRGKRTGRRIHATRVATNEDGLQNMEAFFDAQTIEEVTEDAKPPAAKKKKRIRTPQTPKPKTPKASVRLSVGNDNEDNDDEDDDDEDDMKDYQAAALTQKYITKLKTSITSPSELSKVSTAPPTPHEREATRFAANDDDEKSDDDDDDALLTQEKEELVVPQSAAETAGAKPQLLDRVESPEPAFPPMDLEDVGIKAHSDDEDFDMGPPDQDDDDDDDDDVPAPETEPEDKKPKASSKMESDTEDDDDKEDDKEGTNFHMVHDPETPASVRQKRADEEKAALERKRGRTKKKRSDSDDDDEEEIQTPVRKIKKKKKRHVAFSPQGVPIANRSYKAVPVADLVEESPGEDGPRRSRRAKCKPLDYWKNEKFEYGAHHETGVLGEAMGDMPIVVNVVKAMPTPYKKRQVTKNSSSKEQNGHNAVKRPAVEDNQEPFDTKRLRKKYKVVDGEIAHIWDDTADDSADLSKYTTNMTWIACLACIFCSHLTFSFQFNSTVLFLQRWCLITATWKAAVCHLLRQEPNKTERLWARQHKPLIFPMTTATTMQDTLWEICGYRRRVSRTPSQSVLVRKRLQCVSVSQKHWKSPTEIQICPKAH
jgi:centromere protein C